MKKKRKNYTKAKNLSFNNPRDKFELDRISYQNYQRKQYTNEKSIDINHLENAFHNEIYYRAMKEIPLQEKKVLYLAIFEASDLENVCKTLKVSKSEVIRIKASGIKHFKENVEKYKKMYPKKNCGGTNG